MIYGCLQPRELWFIDFIMYMYVYIAVCIYICWKILGNESTYSQRYMCLYTCTFSWTVKPAAYETTNERAYYSVV